MRNELFAYYVEVGHSLYYYKNYAISARRISNIYSGVLLLASATGIASLSIWERIPSVWTVVILVAQIMQALQPLTQASKQRDALQYIVQDVDELFNEIWEFWNKSFASEIEGKYEDEVMEQILVWKKREREINKRFSSNLDFPFKKRIDKKAKEENEKYFWYYHSVKIEENIDDEGT